MARKGKEWVDGVFCRMMQPGRKRQGICVQRVRDTCKKVREFGDLQRAEGSRTHGLERARRRAGADWWEGRLAEEAHVTGGLWPVGGCGAP